jgi:hypothetical protein
MVVNLRGTGGAGKSYIVREMMRRCAAVAPEYVAERRRPIGYRCSAPAGRTLYVPGHYDTACGGCDTIKTPDEVYQLVEREAASGSDVLFEGIIVQDEWRRCAALAERFPVAVIALEVPIEVCLASIQARRDARGDGRPLNPTNTVNRARRLEATARKLALVGVDVRWLSRDAALARCAALLGLSEPLAREQEEDDGFRLS